MIRSALALVIAATALAGCDPATTRATLETTTFAGISADVARSAEEAFRELPFTRGPVAVLVAEDGRLRGYRLFPCRSGDSVCLGSPQGPAAPLGRSDSHYIVAFPGGRTFFLRPGGDGTMRAARGDVPLAWNSFVNGVPAWPASGFPLTPWITQVPPGPAP